MAKSQQELRQIARLIKDASLKAMDDLASDNSPHPDAAARRKACQDQVRTLVRRLLKHNVPTSEILNDLKTQ